MLWKCYSTCLVKIMIHKKKKFHLQHSEEKLELQTKPSGSKFSVFTGLLLALLSGLFYSSTAVIVKKMTGLHPGQLATYRFLAVLTFSFPESIKSGENILGPKNLRFLLMIRGIFGATNLFLNFIAFRYLPLGEAAIIIFSVPIFVTVAAKIFLKEPCGIFQTLTVFLTVVGIMFNTKIPSRLAGSSFTYSTEFIYGILAAFASLIFSTGRFIVLRKVKSVHHAVIMFNSSWVAIIESVILTLLLGNFKWHSCGLDSILIVVLGIISYIGQTMLTIALQCENAGPISTMRAAADIVLAFLWQTLFFREVPDAFSISGAVLISFSVITVGLQKWVSSLPPESSTFKRLKWMTL
ncbi:solute carrier family 35 member G1-like [Stegodyphus dumicola]|uniref:solute carrier family 35 member G1-like n=1 Tax=Stegodyphus dumicola TaxID=202533 RepID=UPI0015B0F2C4|nr:solute carrier family 35 member G1-like [Stegodyphus dumicola]